MEKVNNFFHILSEEIRNNISNIKKVYALINNMGFIRNLILGFLYENPQEPIKSKKIPVLLVQKKSTGQECGFVAQLNLEIYGKGNRTFYPASHMAFVKQDNDSRQQRMEEAAKRTRHYSYKTLTPAKEDSHLMAFAITIPPRTGHEGVGYQHEGEEYVYVLSGEVEMIW